MQVERTGPKVLTIRDTVTSGWEQRHLLISDIHFDSIHCDRKLLSKHLEQAKSSGAGVIVVGDWFDAMQGKQDRRGSKQDIRPEDKRDNYLDSIVDNSASYLAAYQPHLIMLSDGNHETAITRHAETDLLERLTRYLDTQHMPYSGFLRFMFSGKSGGRTTKRLYYHHGAGGGGPVTKGVPAAHRRAASVEADIYVSGHIHESWYLENVMTKCNDNGRIQYCTQHHVQLPTYKQEAGEGYHDEKGRPAKPLGGYWLIFHYDNTQPGNVGIRFERAS